MAVRLAKAITITPATMPTSVSTRNRRGSSALPFVLLCYNDNFHATVCHGSRGSEDLRPKPAVCVGLWAFGL
jgi:hypothetical protein